MAAKNFNTHISLCSLCIAGLPPSPKMTRAKVSPRCQWRITCSRQSTILLRGKWLDEQQQKFDDFYEAAWSMGIGYLNLRPQPSFSSEGVSKVREEALEHASLRMDWLPAWSMQVLASFYGALRAGPRTRQECCAGRPEVHQPTVQRLRSHRSRKQAKPRTVLLPEMRTHWKRRRECCKEHSSISDRWVKVLGSEKPT